MNILRHRFRSWWQEPLEFNNIAVVDAHLLWALGLG